MFACIQQACGMGFQGLGGLGDLVPAGARWGYAIDNLNWSVLSEPDPVAIKADLESQGLANVAVSIHKNLPSIGGFVTASSTSNVVLGGNSSTAMDSGTLLFA